MYLSLTILRVSLLEYQRTSQTQSTLSNTQTLTTSLGWGDRIPGSKQTEHFSGALQDCASPRGIQAFLPEVTGPVHVTKPTPKHLATKTCRLMIVGLNQPNRGHPALQES